MEQGNFLFEKPEPEAVIAARPHILTISELTALIREVVESSFVDVWVAGEISNLRTQTSRHWYFSLKDSASQIRAIIFGAAERKISFKLNDGLEVICHGRLNVYAPQGTYSLVIDTIEPQGIGALQLAFEQLKKKLEAEGLFALARKRPLPFLPRKIGVVTSPTGAAIRDIVHVLTRRHPGIDILLAPVKVQGEGAAEDIAQAIALMNRRDDIDVMIVGRGGGSMEELWAFNEEVVARAIFNSQIPVISAVGHEIDFTIADFVADVRAATPSAAAELAVPVVAELVARIAEWRQQLVVALRATLVQAMARLRSSRDRLRDPRARFPDLLLRVDGLRARLAYAFDVGWATRRSSLAQLASNLNHLSPLAILAKGYAVVEVAASKRAVRSARELTVGDNLKLLFHEGSAQAKVTKLHSD